MSEDEKLGQDVASPRSPAKTKDANTLGARLTTVDDRLKIAFAGVVEPPVGNLYGRRRNEVKRFLPALRKSPSEVQDENGKYVVTNSVTESEGAHLV